jgi:putative ABC transport system substrate-binding protein
MQRRQFIALLGTTAALPLVARAQQSERIRRIGILSALAADAPEVKVRIGAFLQALGELGWIEGRNVKIDIRFAAGNIDDARKYAAELIALAPDIIFTGGNATATPLLQATRDIAIVFAIVPDPVGAGYIDSLARPGGNATGFAPFEYSIGVKWLELLKQVAPGVTRVAVLRDATIAAGIGQFGAIQSAAPSLALELTPIGLRDAADIERSITEFARVLNAGMIIPASGFANLHRNLIVELAARYKLPAVYWERTFVNNGGLISYGPNVTDEYRRAAGYVDRILRGEKPANLPVQAPTKYEMVINLKTAKALGVTMSPSLLALADELIE